MSLKITVDLTPAQIKEAITMWLRATGDLEAQNVRFECSHSYEQFDRGPGTPILKKAIVDVVPVNKANEYNSLAAQIASIEGGRNER